MKTLHLYLTRQVAASLVLTLAVFTFVLLLANLLKEIVELLVNRQASLLTVLQALAYLVPFVLVFALPMALLTSTLLVFGRFSADQELTAARAGGLSLVSLVSPVLLLSVLLSGLSAWFNMQVGPACRMAYKELLFRIGLQSPTAQLQPNQFIRSFHGYVIYVGDVDGPELRNLVIYEMETNAPPVTDEELLGTPALPGVVASIPRVATILSAPRATLTLDVTNQILQLAMPEVEAIDVASWSPLHLRDAIRAIPVDLSRPSLGAPPLSDMTSGELLRTFYELRSAGVDVTPVKVQMHRQVAFSFACIGFTLVGIPLAVRAHRRETSAGVGIALLLVVIYHGFVVLAQAWETYPERHPHLILWIPNLLFHGLGAWLLWNANRRG
jgi:lipopolysaccharide export system permease protein